jgi:uncharacterized membrane protein YccC
MWQWDETEGPPFTLQLCETELSIRAEIIRELVSTGGRMSHVELAVCRAVAVKLLMFAVAWLDSRLDLACVTSGQSDVALELAIQQLVEAKNQIVRPNLEPDELVAALDFAADLLRQVQKSVSGRLGSLPN